MKILKMTATFGSLAGAVLELGPGLTLIELPNEGGKSTWSAFIRAMLYGFPVRDRDRAGYVAEKNRYQPWSGAAMEGSMEVEWQGKYITLYRGPHGAIPWGTFSAVYTATKEPVEELNGDNCGELLVGVSREVFERTAFVGQSGVLLTPSAELEKRIAALAAAGEEAVSFSQVERRLKDWMNRRKLNSCSGRIPELEEELSELRQRRSNQSELLQQTQEAQRRKEELERERDQLEAALRSKAAQRRAQAEEERNAAYQAVERAEQVLIKTPPEEVLRQAQGDLSLINSLRTQERKLEKEIPALRERSKRAAAVVQANPNFSGLTAEQAGQKAEADHDEILRLVRHRWGGMMSLIGLVVGGVLGYVLPIDLTPAYLPPVVGAVGGGLILGLVGLVSSRLKRLRADRILERYRTDTPEDLFDLADDYGKQVRIAGEEKKKLEAAERSLRETTQQQTNKTRGLMDLVHVFAPEVNELYGVAAAISRALHQGEKLRLARTGLESAEKLLNALPDPGAGIGLMSAAEDGETVRQLAAAEEALTLARDEASHLDGELKAQGDPSQLEAWENELKEELEQREEEYQALAAAMESLRRADNRLRERFSPAINRRAGEYLSVLTGGKYDTAALTRQFQALARETGETASRQDAVLSKGTAQQLYLALRLALCDLALPRMNPCPILLDDVLDTFDDRRTKLALGCLMNLAQKRQVLLFTCHRRERTMLAGTSATILFDR